MTLSFRDKTPISLKLKLIITGMALVMILQLFTIEHLLSRIERLETFSDNSSRVLFALYTRVKKYEHDMPDFEDLPEEDPAIAIEPL